MQKLSATHPLEPDRDSDGAPPRSFGVEREEWYAEARCSGEQVVVTMTAPDPPDALMQLITSGDPIDRWFKDEVRRLTGRSLTAVFGHVLPPQPIRH